MIFVTISVREPKADSSCTEKISRLKVPLAICAVEINFSDFL